MERGVSPASSRQNQTSVIFKKLKVITKTKNGSKFPNRNRLISTPRLNTLPCLHLEPINLVIFQESQTILNLEVGFPLRCFQRLSIPDLATQQCPGRDSWQTRGQSSEVLSYYHQIFSSINACSR